MRISDWSSDVCSSDLWVAESQRSLPPITAGRFRIRGSHVTEPAPPGAIDLLIDANAAFGTGRHETTRGCLLALQDIARRRPARRPVTPVLDMGCGSGVLAMRSEEHTSELQSLMRISYAVFCLKKKKSEH